MKLAVSPPCAPNLEIPEIHRELPAKKRSLPSEKRMKPRDVMRRISIRCLSRLSLSVSLPPIVPFSTSSSLPLAHASAGPEGRAPVAQPPGATHWPAASLPPLPRPMAALGGGPTDLALVFGRGRSYTHTRAPRETVFRSCCWALDDTAVAVSARVCTHVQSSHCLS